MSFWRRRCGALIGLIIFGLCSGVAQAQRIDEIRVLGEPKTRPEVIIQ